VIRTRTKGFEVYVLVLLLAIEAMGALYGGFNLIMDPSGESLNLPARLLENTFFRNYIIPGLVLFLMLGLFPLILIYPMLVKPDWSIFHHLNIYSSYYWAYTFTIYNAIMLIIWIFVQMMVLEAGSVIQGAFGLMGVLILVLALTPRVKRYYKTKRHTTHHTSSRASSSSRRESTN
jgi:hypothetical protein